MTSAYFTIRDKDEKGDMQYYILQKAFPHMVGRLVTFPIEGALANEPISGYNLWITWNSTLRGNYIPDYRNFDKEIAMVFAQMSAWFYAERIIMDKNRFKKFKINKDVSSPVG